MTANGIATNTAKRNKRLTLCFTESEMAALVARAGRFDAGMVARNALADWLEGKLVPAINAGKMGTNGADEQEEAA